MSQIKRLQTIDADTLQSTAYEPVSFMVDDLLPQGLHLLAGAPKIGKSWLALWLCLRSEEHTSELQSRFKGHIVCRLLLEIGRASCRERV